MVTCKLVSVKLIQKGMRSLPHSLNPYKRLGTLYRQSPKTEMVFKTQVYKVLVIFAKDSVSSLGIYGKTVEVQYKQLHFSNLIPYTKHLYFSLSVRYTKLVHLGITIEYLFSFQNMANATSSFFSQLYLT